MIHQYKLNGYNIVMDVNSGAVHSVDEVAYDIIALYDKGVPREEIIDEIKAKYGSVADSDVDETIADIEELKAEKLLFSDDPFEEIAGDLKAKQSVLKAICLHVAHGCNMDCKYCLRVKVSTVAKLESCLLKLVSRHLTSWSKIPEAVRILKLISLVASHF